MKIDGPKEIERPTLMDVIGIGTGIEFFFRPCSDVLEEIVMNIGSKCVEEPHGSREKKKT